MVVTDLRDKVRAAGDEWSEAVILYRTNNQSAVLEDNLRRRGIPYRIYKGSSFYDHKEIRDMMAYIRLVINPRDDEAFQAHRQLSGPRHRRHDRAAYRGIGRRAGASLDVGGGRRAGRRTRHGPRAAHHRPQGGGFRGDDPRAVAGAQRQGAVRFRTGDRLAVGHHRGLPHGEHPEAASALDNIEELLNSMQEFEERVDAEIRGGERQEEEEATIEEWLQNMMLMTDMDQEDPTAKNKVTLMTVHSAKGLEYKYVYIVGLEENLFPSQRAVESPGRHRGGAAPVLRGPDPRQGFGDDLLRRNAFQVGQYGVFASELFPARDRPPVHRVGRRFRGRRVRNVGPATTDPRPSTNYAAASTTASSRNSRGADVSGGGGNGGSGGYGSRSGSGGGFGRAGRRRSRVPRVASRGLRSPGVRRRPRSGAGADAPAFDRRHAPCRRASGDGRRPFSGSAAAVSGEYVGTASSTRNSAWASCSASRRCPRTTNSVVAFDNAGEKTLLAKFAKLTKL